jgi:hypothetical protein
MMSPRLREDHGQTERSGLDVTLIGPKPCVPLRMETADHQRWTGPIDSNRHEFGQTSYLMAVRDAPSPADRSQDRTRRSRSRWTSQGTARDIAHIRRRCCIEALSLSSWHGLAFDEIGNPFRGVLHHVVPGAGTTPLSTCVKPLARSAATILGMSFEKGERSPAPKNTGTSLRWCCA